jgi:hypothetical protein
LVGLLSREVRGDADRVTQGATGIGEGALWQTGVGVIVER